MASLEEFILEDIQLLKEAGEEQEQRLKMYEPPKNYAPVAPGQERFQPGATLGYSKDGEPATEIIVHNGKTGQIFRGPDAVDNAHQMQQLMESMHQQNHDHKKSE